MKDGCVFCAYAGPNEILWETPSVYVIEPLRQVTPGHVLVIPRAHATDFAAAAAVTAAAFRGAAEFVQYEELGDCNLITSKGEAASQMVFHVHVHVLPRTWDDNVTLPWRNPNENPLVWGIPGQHRYALRVHNAGVDSTCSRLGQSAEDAVNKWYAEYPHGNVLKVTPMFTKEAH